MKFKEIIKNKGGWVGFGYFLLSQFLEGITSLSVNQHNPIYKILSIPSNLHFDIGNRFLCSIINDEYCLGSAFFGWIITGILFFSLGILLQQIFGRFRTR